MKTALLIANPIAGRGRGAAVAERARGVLERGGYSVRLVHTWSDDAPEAFARVDGIDPRRPAAAVARAAGATADRIVVVGGDGTFRETLEGLGENAARTPVACIPLGNANVTAHELGLSAPDRDIDWVLSERTVTFDVGRANGCLFLSVVGVGYDALVTAWVDRTRRSLLGRAVYRLPLGGDLLYVGAGLVALARVLPTRFSLSVDGDPWSGRYASIWVANTESYAKRMSIAPGAAADDGELDVHACAAAGPITPFRIYAAARARRRAPRRLSTYGRGRRILVETDRPFLWQADGDPMPRTERLEIEVLPSYARFVVPANRT